MSWRDYFNQDTPLYVNARHLAVHSEIVARHIIDLLPPGAPAVLDFGCGEALAAERVAERCGMLYLSDGAELVRSRLAARFASHGNVRILSPEDRDVIPVANLDLVIVNSVVQYLARAELEGLLAEWSSLLKPDGRLVVADVIPPDVGPVTDVAALLRLAAGNGFLFAAIGGLVRTALSDYSRLRARLGLSHYSEADMLTVLASAGYSARRHHPNMGHNQARMAFVATPLSCR